MIVMIDVYLLCELKVQCLKNELVNNYRNGNLVIYISIYNNKKDTLSITNELIAS